MVIILSAFSATSVHLHLETLASGNIINNKWTAMFHEIFCHWIPHVADSNEFNWSLRSH